ncbi:MAG: hypothetical protein HY293_06165 [Planctomycetes bacterium]|nr:hypothetical protein [Planctomycetota bacterium]
MEPPRVPNVFADGLVLRAGLASPFFITDADLRLAEAEKPLVAVYDSGLVPSGLRGPSETGFDPQSLLRARLLPESAVRSPVLILCDRMAPLLQSALVVQKLRGLAQVAVARVEDAAMIGRLLDAPLLSSPGELAEARRYVPASRVVATAGSTWLWTASGRSIPASRCEDLVVPRSAGPLREAFDLWRKKRDSAVAAAFNLPQTEAGGPVLEAVEVAASPGSGAFDGRVVVWEELLDPKSCLPLVAALKKLPGRGGPLLLVVARIDPGGLASLRAEVRSLQFPVLVAAVESTLELEDLATVTGAQPLFRDLGLPIGVLDPAMLGRFHGARWAGGLLSFEGGGDLRSCQALARRLNADFVLAEGNLDREAILRRWSRLSAELPKNARKALR